MAGFKSTVLKSEFLTEAEAIAAKNPTYRIGGTGTDGSCDCIGLVIGAIRRAGGYWTGKKGTNYSARNEMRELYEIGSASELKIGEAVYKAHEPGETGYDAATIGRSYGNSPDQRDYYHVGIVLGVSPLRILHMTSPAARVDHKLGRWRFHGRLKKVEYGDTEQGTGVVGGTGTSGSGSGGSGEMAVSGSGGAGETGMPGTGSGGGTGTSGNITEGNFAVIGGGNLSLPVNQRARGTRKAVIIGRIPQNAGVELLKWGKEWCRIRYEGRKGYVMTKFVKNAG